MPTDPFSENTAALRALGGQRVWSLMISLFGDLAQGAGDRIDGPVLSAIMARQHIKPEAVRVALHRLRKDGWVTSEKSGRIRQHSLTDKGRRESAIASPRIYARPGSETQELAIDPASAQRRGHQRRYDCTRICRDHHAYLYRAAIRAAASRMLWRCPVTMCPVGCAKRQRRMICARTIRAIAAHIDRPESKAGSNV